MSRQATETYLAQAVEAAQDACAYDVNVRNLLADKQILARILKYTVKEFEEMAVMDIIDCIGDDIEVNAIPVSPGLTNLGRVKESKADDSVPGEGAIYFDIRFCAYHRDSEVKYLINLEAQKSSTPGRLGYHLENRIVFYMARMISAQKNTEFHNQDYDNLRNVRSIWICMDGKKDGDAIEEINLERKTVFGNGEESHRIDLLQGIIIHIRGGKNVEPSQNVLISMLETLLSSRSVADKKRTLETEYGMVMTMELEGRMNTMCNISEFFIEEAELSKSRQVIYDFLGKLGNIPEDICRRIDAEEDSETLRKWYMSAPGAKSFEEFRGCMI